MGRQRGGEGEPGEERPVQPGIAGTRNDADEAASARASEGPEGGPGHTARATVATEDPADQTLRLEREQAGSGDHLEVDRGDRREQSTPIGWVDESAGRLLNAVYDLAGADPEARVDLGEAGTGERGGAAQRAGIDLSSTGGIVERDIAARYLQNMGYVERLDGTGPAQVKITTAGIDNVRRARGLYVEPPVDNAEGGKMSEKMQTRLLSILTIVLFVVLNGRVKKFIDKRVPERRGIRDDLLEASLQGVARLAAVFGASLVVKRLIGSRD